MKTRKETDFLGSLQIPDNALYGIHAARARENFPADNAFPFEWYKAMGLVKLACYHTYEKFSKAVVDRYKEDSPIKLISPEILQSLISAAEAVSRGEHFSSFIVPAVQGGAGTSINMNVNEIIANVALLNLGYKAGQYQFVDPVEHANVYQSTNDVVPTALKVALLEQLSILENEINDLRKSTEEIEKKSRSAMRVGYTQMQEAVPSSFGLLFAAYNEALSRDWWRVSKCFERIKMVNLGGSAIGTGMAVPRFFIMEAVTSLQRLTNLPLTRSENMPDATSNLDSYVEVHAILKAHAVNLEKISSDIRLLASDVSVLKELKIPARQTGSSIMPGKINPVIPEYIISIAHKIYANDMLISGLCAQGCLELNAYLPVIGAAMLESVGLLIAACRSLRKNLMEGISLNTEVAYSRLISSPAITTALVPYIGYHKAEKLSACMRENSINVFDANNIVNIIPAKKLAKILNPEELLKTGFSLTDLKE